MIPERWSGMRLSAFLERHGRIHPDRQFLCPNSLSQVGVIRIGKDHFSYSIAEHDDYFSRARVQELSDKFDKYDGLLLKKDTNGSHDK